MRRPRSAAGALVTASTVLAATQAQVLVLILAGVLVLLLCLGVVLPAVWLGDAHRRRDARAVLQQLLNLVRQPRSP